MTKKLMLDIADAMLQELMLNKHPRYHAMSLACMIIRVLVKHQFLHHYICNTAVNVKPANPSRNAEVPLQ